MPVSIFDLFSIGIGPSSSHTVGPMRAAFQFAENLLDNFNNTSKIKITLYGSLAFTGHGHGTPKALLMGLEGEKPESIDPESIAPRIETIYKKQSLKIFQKKAIPFSPEEDIIFNYQDSFEHHPNAMKFTAFDNSGSALIEALYFSVGGGFIVNQLELETRLEKDERSLPHPFESATELLGLCKQHDCSIAKIMLENEKTWRSEEAIHESLLNIAKVMSSCIKKGCEADGILPGGLGVRRRAPSLYRKLKAEQHQAPETRQVMNWLNLYAMAVNEENAAGARVVTAPTNGAAGIIPAVLEYYKNFQSGNEQGIIDYLLTTGAIGILYKKNASISGAEMGCQGEVGVACSMAAAGLAAALGGSMLQVENAAEIGMEHNLGLTCDPVAGLVQIPCIERNAMASVKAVNAAQLALAEEGEHKVSLDMAINTMREIGENMNSIYKETSKGGLAVAVNIVAC